MMDMVKTEGLLPYIFLQKEDTKGKLLIMVL